MSNDFKPVLKIILRFIILYLVLLFSYQFYLNIFEGKDLDLFSKWVAQQSTFCQNHLGYPSLLVDQPKYETIWFFVNNHYISRMVEGCNAVSVMIMFLAFIFAFYKGVKTFVFAGFGVVFLHIINVLRIAGLNILLIEYPQYGKIGHDYFFPAIIYGCVVFFWLIWVKFFVLKNQSQKKW